MSSMGHGARRQGTEDRTPETGKRRTEEGNGDLALVLNIFIISHLNCISRKILWPWV